MTINIKGPELREIKPRILVLGVGGAGGNALNGMIEAGMEGVEFVAVNTDAQDLINNKASGKIQLGANLTKGLGAGAKHEIGQAAAEESLNDIIDYIKGSNMVFITAGMGGGTGTGASHVIARAAKELNILTVGVVTLPFSFEGPKKMRIALQGIEELKKHLDTNIIVPNQNLFKIINEKTSLKNSFALSNNVLKFGVQSVTDLMVKPGLINLDFADVETIMKGMGKAMMGTGEAEGEKRAEEATNAALLNPLIDEYSLKGAKGLLVNITGGSDLTLFEVDEAVNKFQENDFDFVSNNLTRTYPIGIDTEVFSFNTLEKAWKEAKLPSEREHVTPFMKKNNKIFKIYNLENSKKIPIYRLTIDRREDLQFLKKIAANIKKKPILMNDIYQLFAQKPDILELYNDKMNLTEGYNKSLKEDEEFLKKTSDEELKKHSRSFKEDIKKRYYE